MAVPFVSVVFFTTTRRFLLYAMLLYTRQSVGQSSIDTSRLVKNGKSWRGRASVRSSTLDVFAFPVLRFLLRAACGTLVVKNECAEGAWRQADRYR